MNEPFDRPDPDQLLNHIKAEEQARRRGQLKIFLGYAAGVGKTYAMLEAAHQRKEEGVDVVVGYVETHNRLETESLLRGLEVIPRKFIEYRGVHLGEMNVDAIMTRQPALVLVDEMAHTNAPGSRHPKRYQDVEELLTSGIDVYTTLNVQHLESLNDVVAQITGTQIHETVPDVVIDEAAEVELVDLPPDELLNRLRDGKVYIPEQAARAIEKFFRKGNLTALREISMRRAAERVDHQMRAYMQTRAIPGPWPASERLLVCIGPNPLGERLVRSTRRLADELHAAWFAVYVEATGQSPLSEERRTQIFRTLRLAEELGARVSVLPLSSGNHSVAGTILEYARKNNVTKIIAGKPLRPRLLDVVRSSIVDQMIRQSGKIDVYVVSSTGDEDISPQDAAWQPHRPWRRYIWSALLIVVTTGIGEMIGHDISPTNLVMLYLLAVVIAAIYLGLGPSILASILGVLAFDYFFVPPRLTLAISDTEYLITFAGLFTVGVVISYLTVRARQQADAAQRREADTAALYSLSRDLAAADSLDAVIQAVTTHIEQAFGREVAIFLPASDQTLQPYRGHPGFEPDEAETAVAAWAFTHGEPAGRGTDTLPAARTRYLPLKTSQRVVGVLGAQPKVPGSQLTPDQQRLLQAFASQAASAIERVQLAKQAHQAELLQAAEKLQTALLNSISHDLRTPLVSITGALTSLQDGGILLDEEIRDNLIETARQEADRLNRLVGNLLSMTRLEGNAMKVVTSPGDIQDAVGAALEQLKDRLGDRLVQIHVPDDFPLVPMDFVLIVQVLVNLIDNAAKYSPPDSPIEIQARLEDDQMCLTVSDQGIGIPEEDLVRVFDKFYRVQRPDNVTGTGLGLAICKGIVESHGGSIMAQNRPGGGVTIYMGLPLKPSTKENRL
jgi:two-component system sensor histidine kinase KdpD